MHAAALCYCPPVHHSYCAICTAMQSILALPLDEQLEEMQAPVLDIDYPGMHALLIAKGITRLPYEEWLKLFRL